MLNSSEPIDVAATDQVLACLMAAPQGKYSWHLHLTKVEGKLLIDKANGSIVDLLTVNETAIEPPMQDAEVLFRCFVDGGWCLNQTVLCSRLALVRASFPGH